MNRMSKKEEERLRRLQISSYYRCVLCDSPLVMGVTLHPFPKYGEERERWLEYVSRFKPEFNPELSQVCSQHFTTSCWKVINRKVGEFGVGIQKVLKPGAIPSIFNKDKDEGRSGSIPTSKNALLSKIMAPKVRYESRKAIKPAQKINDACTVCGSQRNGKILLFGLPKVILLKIAWMDFVERFTEDFKEKDIPLQHIRVCSQHFDHKCFEKMDVPVFRNGFKIDQTLKVSAVPSIYWVENSNGETSISIASQEVEKAVTKGKKKRGKSKPKIPIESKESADSGKIINLDPPSSSTNLSNKGPDLMSARLKLSSLLSQSVRISGGKLSTMPNAMTKCDSDIKNLFNKKEDEEKLIMQKIWKQGCDGPTPFVCSTNNCGEGFLHVKFLTEHEKFHKKSDERFTYNCCICNAKFFTFRSYDNHLISHFGPFRRFCALCGKPFESKNKLHRHYSLQHGNRYLAIGRDQEQTQKKSKNKAAEIQEPEFEIEIDYDGQEDTDEEDADLGEDGIIRMGRERLLEDSINSGNRIIEIEPLATEETGIHCSDDYNKQLLPEEEIHFSGAAQIGGRRNIFDEDDPKADNNLRDAAAATHSKINSLVMKSSLNHEMDRLKTEPNVRNLFADVILSPIPQNKIDAPRLEIIKDRKTFCLKLTPIDNIYPILRTKHSVELKLDDVLPEIQMLDTVHLESVAINKGDLGGNANDTRKKKRKGPKYFNGSKKRQKKGNAAESVPQKFKSEPLHKLVTNRNSQSKNIIPDANKNDRTDNLFEKFYLDFNDRGEVSTGAPNTASTCTVKEQDASSRNSSTCLLKSKPLTIKKEVTDESYGGFDNASDEPMEVPLKEPAIYFISENESDVNNTIMPETPNHTINWPDGDLLNENKCMGSIKGEEFCEMITQSLKLEHGTNASHLSLDLSENEVYSRQIKREKLNIDLCGDSINFFGNSEDGAYDEDSYVITINDDDSSDDSQEPSAHLSSTEIKSEDNSPEISTSSTEFIKTENNSPTQSSFATSLSDVKTEGSLQLPSIEMDAEIKQEKKDKLIEIPHTPDIDPSLFSCKYCGLGFFEESRAENHLPFHFETDLSLYKQYFVKKSRITRELRTKRCSVCNQTFSTYEKFHKHYIKHLSYKPFVCKICYAIYQTADQLLQHNIDDHHISQQFPCSLCSASCKSLQELEKHLNSECSVVKLALRPTSQSQVRSAVKEESGMVKSEPESFVKNESGKKQCDLCSVSFHTLKELKQHYISDCPIVKSSLQTPSSSLLGATRTPPMPRRTRGRKKSK
ncbi:uncharacterized protein LOC126829766 [Patella vulgata]|uniref:uncharacterized protein LOC126829766 n=1 Tax=Patella vulgata TaxID=6465 RepID=UPI00217FFD5C|nr:uncharacterized protein LOC126829766 [Patella vulgata]